MNICSTHLKLKQSLTYVTLKDLQHLTRNFRIKNLDDFERDEPDAYSRTFKCEEERNDHMPHYEQVFGNVFEWRESRCCAVLMKHCHKVKDE